MELSRFLLVSLILFCFSCDELSEFETKQINEALVGIDSLFNSTESWNVDMDVIEGGSIKLNLKGSYSFNIQDGDDSESRISGPVFISIFDEEGLLETTVTCDSAVYRPEEETFEMFRNVLVKTNEGRELRSDFLLWEKREDKVSTSEFVIFISPPDSIAANGFFGNTDLTNYTLNEGGGQVVID